MNWGEFLLTYFWDLVVMAILLVGSGAISGTETALFNLSRGQIYRMRQSAKSPRRLVSSLMANPRRVLNTLLLANLLVNTLYASLVALLAYNLEKHPDVPGWVLAAVSVAPLLALILLGEVLPKMAGYLWSERWAMVAAPPLAVMARVLSPVVWVLDRALVEPLTRILAPRAVSGDITAEELGMLLEISAKRGVIAHNASELLQEIMGLTELRVADIMVPRVDMIAYDVNDPAKGLLEMFRGSHLRKIPVYDGLPDRVLGVIYGKSLLLNPDKPLRDLVVKVPFVPETANVERLLIQLRVTRRQMAMVVDEFGGLAGLVTLQDIVEEIVGDIPDSRDEYGPAVQRTGERQFTLDGNLGVRELADAFKIDLSSAKISTIGGFVTSLLGRIPREGDKASYRNLHFTVLSLRGRRAQKLLLELSEGGRP